MKGTLLLSSAIYLLGYSLGLFKIFPPFHIGYVVAFAALYLIYRSRHANSSTFLSFGGIVTLFSILTDIFAVHSGGLNYWIGGPLIVYTPIYVLLNNLVRVFLAGESLSLSPLLSIAWYTVFGAGYHILAKFSRLWDYTNVRHISNLVPIYVVALEFISAVFVIFFLNRAIKTSSTSGAMINAIIYGALICVASLESIKYLA